MVQTFHFHEFHHFEGNFIEGFTISRVHYIQNGEIIFSAGRINIDLYLSRLFIDDGVLLEVILQNAYYHNNNNFNTNNYMDLFNFNLSG